MSGSKRFYRDGLMDLSGYRLEPAVADEKWDLFVDRSPQGTVFATSAFLAGLQIPPTLYYCFKNNDLRGAILLTGETAGAPTGHCDLVVYDGVMLAPSDPDQNRAQVISEEFRVLSFIAAELAKLPGPVSFQAHPTLADLRPFVWHNYGEDGPKYTLVLNYTTVVPLDPNWQGDGTGSNLTYNLANKSRRQEVRYGIAAGLRTEERYDPVAFGKLHERTFARQGKIPAPAIGEITAVMDNLHAAGRLRMFISSTAEDIPGSIAVFGTDSRRAYYLYGANEPDLRHSHTGTMVLWHGFAALSRDVREVDLEGVNSPARGYFKLSFGGSLTPYFGVSINTN